MLLVVTASDDATADYLCTRLGEANCNFVRIDTDTFARVGFVEFGAHGASLHMAGASYPPGAFDHVWFRRPRGIVIDGPGTDAQILHTSREWGASLDGFLSHIPKERWMNHPAANAHAGNKLLQLSEARNCGILVPDTLVTRSGDQARNFWAAHAGHVVAKPLSVGYVETDEGVVEAQIYTSAVTAHHLRDDRLLNRCPTLFQQRIDGVDVRVTVVDGVISAMYLHPPPAMETIVDIRRSEMTQISYEPTTLPDEISIRLLQMLRSLELRFGAVDFIKTTSDEWFFLEVNPNGQWAWMDLLGTSNIAQKFIDAFGKS